MPLSKAKNTRRMKIKRLNDKILGCTATLSTGGVQPKGGIIDNPYGVIDLRDNGGDIMLDADGNIIYE